MKLRRDLNGLLSSLLKVNFLESFLNKLCLCVFDGYNISFSIRVFDGTFHFVMQFHQETKIR